MKIDLKTFILYKESKFLDSIPATLESLDLITKANTEIIQSIYDSKTKLEEGEVFIETLSIKILLATKSIIELSRGTNVSALTTNNNSKLLDFPSINILTRSIIEAFLTMEYLFYNNLCLEEKKFRFYIWQISGYKARQGLFQKRNGLKKHVTDKLKSEQKEIERLLILIEESPFYKKMNKQSLWKLDKYGLPRLVSWIELIKQSILKNSIFERSYKLYSNYAHSEFISLIQMNERKSLIKGQKENNDNILIPLRAVKMINCISMICLKNKYDFASNVFNEYDKETQETIVFWNDFGTE